MRFRTGAILGFAVGYYLGARAGRERYEELRRILDALPVGVAMEKAAALVELGVERIRHSRGSDNVLPLRTAAPES